MAKSSKAKTKKKKDAKPEKVSYHKRPDDDRQLDLWQFKLRKQYGEETDFDIVQSSKQGLLGAFVVSNAETRGAYTVELFKALPSKDLPAPASLFSLANTCSCQDFKTNRLGFCKHLAAVLHAVSKKRGGKKALREGWQPAQSRIYVDYQAGRRIRLYLSANDHATLIQWAESYFDAEGFLLQEQIPHFEEVLYRGRELNADLACSAEAFDLVAERRDRLRRLRIIDAKIPLGADDPYMERLLTVSLFPYQRKGVVFAARAGRCLIADEMGLGKTIQAIGATEILRREIGIQRAIVVCPSSLKYQWKMEIEKFCNASVTVIEGGITKRMEQYAKSETFFHILSYNTLANDAEKIGILNADLLIIDEAQRLKNFRTKVSAQLKKVRTPYCFVLTGTPLENRVEDLYSLMQFVDQYRFPPLYRFLDRYQVLGENGQVVGYKNLREISDVLADCMIRRLKKDVLKQLPARMDKVLFVPMTQQQRDIHNDLADAVARLVAKWRRFNYLNETDRRMLILMLSQMRMVADSTYILDQKTRFDTKISELLYILEEYLTEPDNKAVIFSQWERMTRLVAEELTERGIRFAYLHGGIPSAQRGEAIEQFANNPDCRIFLSTDVGGTGLNLQRAALVVNLDIPWNPGTLEQRIARIHRMGQKRRITVINMVSEQSIETRMLDVLRFKTAMAKGALDPDGDDTIFLYDEKFGKFMENVETLTESGWPAPSTQDPQNQPQAAENPEWETPEPNATKPSANEAWADEDKTPPAQETPPAPAPTPAPRAHSDARQPRDATIQNDQAPRANATNPNELIQTGLSFFAGLAQTLSSPEKTQALVQSITDKDEKTGQTYLKIPVENAEMVENVIGLLGGLLAGLNKK